MDLNEWGHSGKCFCPPKYAWEEKLGLCMDSWARHTLPKVSSLQGHLKVADDRIFMQNQIGYVELLLPVHKHKELLSKTHKLDTDPT